MEKYKFCIYRLLTLRTRRFPPLTKMLSLNCILIHNEKDHKQFVSHIYLFYLDRIKSSSDDLCDIDWCCLIARNVITITHMRHSLVWRIIWSLSVMVSHFLYLNLNNYYMYSMHYNDNNNEFLIEGFLKKEFQMTYLDCIRSERLVWRYRDPETGTSQTWFLSTSLDSCVGSWVVLSTRSYTDLDLCSVSPRRMCSRTNEPYLPSSVRCRSPSDSSPPALTLTHWLHLQPSNPKPGWIVLFYIGSITCYCGTFVPWPWS